MAILAFLTIVLIPIVSFSNICAAEENNRSKRILIEDNYYTIVSKLDNLTKELETLKAENKVLSAEVQDLKAVKGVAFQASLSASISGGQKQVIIFDQVELNIGNAYNVHHGNFIAPVNGTYLFSIYACSSSTHVIVLDLVNNGSTVGRVLAGDQNYSNCNSNTFVLELKKGDDVYVTEGTYGDLMYVNAAFGKPQFTGVLLNVN